MPVFFIVGIMPFLLIAALWAFAWIGGDVLYRHRGILMPFIGAYSLLIMFELLHVTLRLYRQIRKHHREEYSNDDDFPVRFAGFVVFLPLVYIIASWILFVSGSRAYNMLLQVCVAVMHVVILIKILHPQRSGLGNVVEETGAAITEKIEEIISSVQTADKDNTFTLPAATMDELEEKIRHALTVQKLYLNPNLKLSDIADAVESNSKYVSLVMNERFDSFYAEVNRLRIKAAIKYKEQHPSADREEIAANRRPRLRETK